MAKRMNKDELPQSLGAFKPVGYVLLAARSGDPSRPVLNALREAGFADEDILDFTSDEYAGRMQQMIDQASGFAGFGYEIVLMRRYKELSDEGWRWLLVYAPDDQATQRVAEIAKRLQLPSAVKYHRLTEEDLV